MTVEEYAHEWFHFCDCINFCENNFDAQAINFMKMMHDMVTQDLTPKPEPTKRDPVEAPEEPYTAQQPREGYPMKSFKIGKKYDIQHRYLGDFTIRLTHVTGSFLTGEITKPSINPLDDAALNVGKSIELDPNHPACEKISETPKSTKD